jgi:hypothetical protein
MLKQVKPEDIKDMSERFLPLFQEGRDSDTVKRINLKSGTPLFVITIVEHESEVNYRSSFKLLQYISLVLDSYEKEAEEKHPGISQTKDFRYPPVLPIVFYDGRDTWNAEVNFRNRTNLNDVFDKYIPGFEYELVDLNRYKQEDITKFNDALSLVMLIDRLENSSNIEILSKLPKDYVEQLGLQIPENLIKLLSKVITVLLSRIKVPKDEIEQITGLFEKKGYNTMFDKLVESVLEEREEKLEEGRKEGREEVLALIRNGATLAEIEKKFSEAQENP